MLARTQGYTHLKKRHSRFCNTSIRVIVQIEQAEALLILVEEPLKKQTGFFF